MPTFILTLFKHLFGCICLYVITYTLLENFLSKRMKESPYLKLMCNSRRLTAIMFLWGSAKGIFIILRILFLLLTSKTPSSSDIISLLLLGFILVLTICYRKTLWYYLTKKDRTVFADWYMKKYFAMEKNKDNIEQAYEYLHKASEYKSDSVFILSMMAEFNERYFRKSRLADEYLAKAQQVLNISNKPPKIKALLASVSGDILMSRNNIDEGLAHLKTACEIDPSNTNIEHYEEALEWANEDEESESS